MALGTMAGEREGFVELRKRILPVVLFSIRSLAQQFRNIACGRKISGTSYGFLAFGRPFHCMWQRVWTKHRRCQPFSRRREPGVLRIDVQEGPSSAFFF